MSAAMVESASMDSESLDVERRADGALLVRVRSSDSAGQQLPDAVFTFRRGDPQYDYWERKLDNTKGC